MLKTADFDGDLRDDIVAITDSAVVSVWLTQPDGSLGPRSDLALPSSASTLAVGDVNGDGKQDVVAYSTTTSLFFGNGNGTFQPRVDLGWGLLNAVRILDMNGDGRPDLVGVSPTYGARVVLASAPGVFSSPTDYPAGQSAAAQGIVAGRFDADTIPDVIVVNQNVYLYRGIGGGALGAAQLLSNMTGGRQLLEAADFDGDGVLDLTLRSGAQQIGLNLGVGDGSFGARVGYGTGTGFPADGYAIGDMDGCGRLDIVSADDLQGGVSILLNQTLTPSVGVPVSIAPPASRLSLEVSPNPARGAIALTIQSTSAGEARVELYDLLGRRVLARELARAPAGRRTVALEAARSLSPGLYIAKGRVAGETAFARVSVVR